MPNRQGQMSNERSSLREPGLCNENSEPAIRTTLVGGGYNAVDE